MNNRKINYNVDLRYLDPKLFFLIGDKVCISSDSDKIIGIVTSFSRKEKYRVLVNFGKTRSTACDWWLLERLPIKNENL